MTKKFDERQKAIFEALDLVNPPRKKVTFLFDVYKYSKQFIVIIASTCMCASVLKSLRFSVQLDNWQLSLLSTHLQLESWIAEYIQWPKYENMQKCPKSKKKLIGITEKNNNNSTSSVCGMEIIW